MATMAYPNVPGRTRARDDAAENLPPVLALVEQSGSEVLRNSYLVDAGEPLGPDYGLLRGDLPVSSEPAVAEERDRQMLAMWRGLGEKGLKGFADSLDRARALHPGDEWTAESRE